MARGWNLSLSVVLLLGGPAAALAQQDFSKVEVTSQKVAEGVYMLTGAGGNIGLSVGADAVFLIDDQYAPMTPKIKAAVAALTRQARAVRAQHALARRPHRGQQEPRRVGDPDRRPRERAQADDHGAVPRGLRDEGAAGRSRRPPRRDLQRLRHLPSQRRRDLRLPHPARTHRRRLPHPVPQGERRPWRRHLLQRHVPVHRSLHRRIGERHDRGRRPDARAGGGQHARSFRAMARWPPKPTSRPIATCWRPRETAWPRR